MKDGTVDIAMDDANVRDAHGLLKNILYLLICHRARQLNCASNFNDIVVVAALLSLVKIYSTFTLCGNCEVLSCTPSSRWRE